METALDTQQQILVEHRLSNERKSTGVAYALWFFLGWAGAHRFYLGKVGTGIAMLLLSLAGVFLSIILIGFVFWLVVGIWWVVDAFLIPGIIAQDQREKRAQIIADMSLAGAASTSADLRRID